MRYQTNIGHWHLKNNGEALVEALGLQKLGTRPSKNGSRVDIKASTDEYPPILHTPSLTIASRKQTASALIDFLVPLLYSNAAARLCRTVGFMMTNRYACDALRRSALYRSDSEGSQHNTPGTRPPHTRYSIANMTHQHNVLWMPQLDAI